MKIISIKKIEYKEEVLNLRISDNHNYFANGICVSNCHKAGSGSKSNGLKQLTTILKHTLGSAYMRFGMSGTFPDNTTLDYLTIQSLHGPKVAEVRAIELMEKGVIANVKIKSLLLNHNDPEFNNLLANIKKSNGKDAYDLERKYIAQSDARLKFVCNNIIQKSKKNTLVLFNLKDYGEKIYNYIRDNIPEVDAYYIDGDTKKDKREWIKQQLEITNVALGTNGTNGHDRPKVLVGSYGVMSTGVSIKNLHVLVLMESYKSEQLVIQSIGRILRLHAEKTTAIVFDIVDIFDPNAYNKNILHKQYLERKSFYEKREYPLEEKRFNIGK